jgi:hypothetical protein
VTNKKALSESDICDRYITPAITNSGWASSQWRQEFGFTDGKIIVRGNLVARGKRKRADYLLFYKPNLQTVWAHVRYRPRNPVCDYAADRGSRSAPRAGRRSAVMGCCAQRVLRPDRADRR